MARKPKTRASRLQGGQELNTKIEDANAVPVKTRVEAPTAKAAPTPKAAPAAQAPKRDLQPVNLQVFLTACGKKPDQTAGFAAYAKVQQMHPRTMPEWRDAFAAFMQRPVT